MTHALHAPPGRAGQLWLRHRAAVAARAVDLLDQKLRLLRAERQRCVLDEQRTRAAWEQACADADTWVLRLAELGGQRAVRLGAAPGRAEVAVRWDQVVGVWYPAAVGVREPDLGEAPAGSATLVEARRRVALAVAAAARHAAAVAALRVLAAEEDGTRRRLRSIRTRYLPLLADTRRRVELALEEDERSELLRMRWAAARGVSTHDQR